MKIPELPPLYSVIDLRTAEDDDNNGRPFHVRVNGELVDELVESRRSYFTEYAEAVEACWDHWREHGDQEWIAYFDSLPDEQREPFTGFEDITDEQRSIAQAEAGRHADMFAAAKMLPPTADDVIFAAHLQTFAANAQDEPGSKPSKLVRAIFDSRTSEGIACTLMLAQLLKRLYSTPYPGLNTAGLDFVNVFVAVVTVAFAGLKKTLKFGGKAKGKRPS